MWLLVGLLLQVLLMMLNYLERILVAMAALINLWVYRHVTHITFPCIGRSQIVRWASRWAGRLIGNISHLRNSDVCEIGIINGLKLSNGGFLESADRLFTDQSIDKAACHWTHFFYIVGGNSISWLFFLPLLYLDLWLRTGDESGFYFFESKQILVILSAGLRILRYFVCNRVILIYGVALLTKGGPQLPWRYNFLIVFDDFHRLTHFNIKESFVWLKHNFFLINSLQFLRVPVNHFY